MQENGQLTVLNIRDVLPNRFQPRIRFDEEKLEELADSISKYGVIQPIVVRPVGNRFEIIAGERRFKASKLANRSTIPAIVVNLSDKDSEEIALLENVQRQELSPIEEAVSYKRILDMGYITQEGLAKKIGKSQSTIANKIRLLNLDDEVQSYLLNNKISERHARSLLRIPDKELQVEMLHRIVNERLTVKQTDREIEKLKENEQIVKPIKLNVPVKNEVEQQDDVKPEEIESLFDDDELNKNERGDSMDIDKIMREAKDINSNVNPESKDIPNLMANGNNQFSTNPNIMPEIPTQEVNLEANKFINVAPQTPENTTPTVQPVNNGVTFDSVFNQHITATPTPSINFSVESVAPTPSVNPSVEPVAPMAKEENSVNVGSTLDNSMSQSVTPNIAQNSMDSVSSPVNSENNFSSVANNQLGGAPLDTVSTNPQVVPEPSIPEMPAPSFDNVNSASNIYAQPEDVEVSAETKKAISTAVASALKTFTENKARQSMASSIPTPVENAASVQSTSNTTSIPDTDIIADDTLSEYANVKPGIANAQPTMASTINQDVKPVTNQTRFADIVKMLRNCADEIEKNGYYVNVDELDIGNQYKVTFTIDKE